MPFTAKRHVRAGSAHGPLISISEFVEIAVTTALGVYRGKKLFDTYTAVVKKKKKKACAG
jgi:uncharacterized membrane protein (DUF485 family)